MALQIAINPNDNYYVNDFPIINYLNNNIVNADGSINSPGTTNNPFVMPTITTTADKPKIDFTVSIVIGILILMIALNT